MEQPKLPPGGDRALLLRRIGEILDGLWRETLRLSRAQTALERRIEALEAKMEGGD